VIEVIPAILTDSSLKLKELVRNLEPYTTRVHIDIADGELVPNKTVTGYDEIKEIESALKFDVHLMVSDPAPYIKEWLHTQADRFIIHSESKCDHGSLINYLHQCKRKAGLAFNPETDVNKFKDSVIKADFVQFMMIHPGFQGQPFLTEVVDKISVFHKENPDIIIMCDGGVTPERAPVLVKAGASALVSGSYIVKSQNIEEAIQNLKTAAGSM